MGKFAPKRVREYRFVSLEELVCDVMREFEEGQEITLVLTAEEVPDYLTAFLSTGKIKPYDIDWAHPDVNGYGGEYYFSLSHFENDVVFVEKAYDTDNCRYLDDSPEFTDILFVSVDVGKALYDKCVNDKHNIVLFDIEK